MNKEFETVNDPDTIKLLTCEIKTVKKRRIVYNRKLYWYHYSKWILLLAQSSLTAKCNELFDFYWFYPFYHSEDNNGFVIELESDIGFGQYTIYETPEGFVADSEHMDSNEDKDALG